MSAAQGVKGPASYFPAIEKRYGKPMQYWFDAVAKRPADETHTDTVAWLKTEHGMGHGHANAIVAHLKSRRD